MSDILRQLAIWICKPIYKCILGLYEIFYTLSTAQFLTSEEVESFSANIYVLVSVVMLFAFSVTILSAIVNPDLLDDKKKGVGAIFKRAIIGLALIVIIPFAFNESFVIQKEVMTSHIIEKVIVGLNFDNEGDSNTGGNGGQIIAGTLMSCMLKPSSDNVQIEVYAGDNVADAYNTMIAKDFSSGIDKVAKYINRAPKEGNEEYAFEFEGLLAIIAGLATAYLLLLFAIDMAIRMFKIAFFELTAPISIVAYIAAGGDVLKNWFKELLHTYLDVFVRIAAMAFYLFLISKINDFISDSAKIHTGSGFGWDVLLKVLLVVGMLIFISRVPKLIDKIFKTDIGSSKGGINSRLGEMAGIGKQAQSAWGKLKQAGKLGSGIAVGGMALGAMATTPLGWGLMGGAWATQHGWRKGFFKHQPIKNTKFGEALTKQVGPSLKDTVGVANAYLSADGVKKGIDAAKKKHEESESGAYNKYINTQEKNKEIKDNATATAQGILNKISGRDYYVKGADGKTKLNTDEVIKDNNFNGLLSGALKGSNLSKFEQDKIIDFNNKRDEKNIAENRVKHYDKAQERLSVAMNATNDQVSKIGIQELKSKMETGTSYAKVKKAIDEIDSMRREIIKKGNIDTDSSAFEDLVRDVRAMGTGKYVDEMKNALKEMEETGQMDRDRFENILRTKNEDGGGINETNIEALMREFDKCVVKEDKILYNDTANNILKSFESAARISDDDASSILEEYSGKVTKETQEKLDEMFTKIRNTGGLVDMESIKAELENIEFNGSEDRDKLFDKIAENLKIDSEEKLNTVLTAKTAAFDKAEKEKDAMLEKMDSDKRKEEFKAMDAIGKDIGKTKIR